MSTFRRQKRFEYLDETRLDAIHALMEKNEATKPYRLHLTEKQAKHLSEELLGIPFKGRGFKFDDFIVFIIIFRAGEMIINPS